MIRNRNGYWMAPGFYETFQQNAGGGEAPRMMPLDLQQFAGGGGGGEGAGRAGNGDQGAGGNDQDGGAGDTGGNEPAGGNGGTGGSGTGSDDNGGEDLNATIAQLKAEMAKQKAALDAATKEAGDMRKALRAKQSAEEIAAEEKKQQEEATKAEIDTLRKKVARAETTKSVMSKLGTDEEASGKIADYLYGAEDVEAALAEVQKAWTAREKALKLEYGKIPPPGAGGNPEDQKKADAIERAKKLGAAQSKANEATQKALNAYMK